VARVAAHRMVIVSRTIHSLTVPRDPRTTSLDTPPSQSAEEVIEADSFCQKSELAMGVSQS
jgi:hypothetical protein